MRTAHLPESHFSDAEQETSMYLLTQPELSYQDIADEREVAKGTVHNAVNRIRNKTRTSFHTLLASPFTEELATELKEEDLQLLIQLLEAAKSENDV